MKTKELIRLLQEEDPTGETECCVDNVDIFTVDAEPAYYDGLLEVLRRDESKKPYWDIIGADYVGTGSKINISTMPIRQLAYAHPEYPIGFIGVGEAEQARRMEFLTTTKAQAVKSDWEMDRDHFIGHIWRRCRQEAWFDKIPGHSTGEFYDRMRTAIREFYEAHLSPHDDLPKLPPKTRTDASGRQYEAHPSINDRKEHRWEQMVTVNLDPVEGLTLQLRTE